MWHVCTKVTKNRRGKNCDVWIMISTSGGGVQRMRRGFGGVMSFALPFKKPGVLILLFKYPSCLFP